MYKRQILIFAGFNLTFFPQFILGYLGMPRRYHVYPDEFQVLNVMSTAGASVLGLGYGLMFAYLIYSLVKGPKAPANPWGAKGLEWEIETPPSPHNFDATPIVDQEAYAYELPDVPIDALRRNPAPRSDQQEEEVVRST